MYEYIMDTIYDYSNRNKSIFNNIDYCIEEGYVKFELDEEFHQNILAESKMTEIELTIIIEKIILDILINFISSKENNDTI